ncbi:MAG: transglycosylase SLT domain-containing protein, partial [Phenylobacterium sp.]
MPASCGYAWSDALDAIIVEEAAGAGVPIDLAYTFIAVESGFDPAARNDNPPLEDSVGLLQLNRLGGQGAGYSVEQLSDPRFNLRVGLPPIASAYAGAWRADVPPYEFIYGIAVQSGHPGL